MRLALSDSRLLNIVAAAAIAALSCGSAAGQTNDQRFEQCKTKLVKAQKLGVLHAFDWKPPAEPHVVVGATFLDLPIDAKEGFAETVNCFLMAGETGKCTNFDVLHWQTGKAIGRFKNCRFRMN